MHFSHDDDLALDINNDVRVLVRDDTVDGSRTRTRTRGTTALCYGVVRIIRQKNTE